MAENKEESVKQDKVDSKTQEVEIKKEKNNDELIKKVIYSLCYFFGILFFLPLIMYKEDAESKLHANNGLLLLLFAIVGNVLFGCITMFGGVVGIIFSVAASLYSVALFVLGIIGVVNIINNKPSELPLIGNIKIIK